MRRIFFIISAIALMLIVLLWGRVYKNEDIIPELFVVGTTANFWPFTFRKGKDIVGFDVDVAHEVVRRLGKKMVLRDVPFTTLIPQLELGSLDMVAAGMAITPERSERVSFSTSYIDKNPLVIASRKPLQTIDDLLAVKTIYTTQGNAYSYLKKFNQNLPIKIIEDGPWRTIDILDITLENDDALVTELLNLDPKLSKRLHIFTLPQTMERTAIAISKNSPLLVTNINKILADMEDDGTMQEFRTKWELI